MFREGGYNPEAARLQHEQKMAAKKYEAELKQAESQRFQGETNKQVEQFAHEAMDKIMEVPALAKRYESDKAFKLEVDELKQHLIKAPDLDRAQRIIDSFSPEVGQAMRDFLPAVTGTEFIPPKDSSYFEDESSAA